MMGYWYGMGPFGWISMLLFWALIIIGIVYLVRQLGKQDPPREFGQQPERADSALHILRERYARGEIDEEEFDRRKRGLS